MCIFVDVYMFILSANMKFVTKYLLVPFFLIISLNLNAQVNGISERDALTGIASYYHDKFNGRKMANGDIFSQQEFTAASNKFPLNCWVKVTNLSNKRSVIVKITDRMAKYNKRIIDLSLVAARELKIIKHGVKRVKAEVLTDYEPLAEN